MAGSINKVIIIGNVGKDPEIKMMPNGNKIVNLTVATSERWKDKNSGEYKEKTEWHRVTIFNEHLADVVERFVTKGSKIYVEGQLQTRKWTDQQGNDKYSTEIVLNRFRGDIQMLDSKQGGRDENENQDTHRNTDGMGGSGPASFDDEDNIPFSPVTI